MMYTQETHETISFVRQTAADGTKFIDISDQLIPMDLKCVYFTYAILPEIQHDLAKLMGMINTCAPTPTAQSIERER